jgi:hypothetical protein
MAAVGPDRGIPVLGCKHSVSVANLRCGCGDGIAKVLDGPVDRRLIQTTFAGDLARLLGLALPLELGEFGQPFFQDQAVLLGELFDSMKDLANGLTHGATSRQFGLGIITRGSRSFSPRLCGASKKSDLHDERPP